MTGAWCGADVLQAVPVREAQGGARAQAPARHPGAPGAGLGARGGGPLHPRCLRGGRLSRRAHPVQAPTEINSHRGRAIARSCSGMHACAALPGCMTSVLTLLLPPPLRGRSSFLGGAWCSRLCACRPYCASCLHTGAHSMPEMWAAMSHPNLVHPSTELGIVEGILCGCRAPHAAHVQHGRQPARGCQWCGAHARHHHAWLPRSGAFRCPSGVM